MTAIAKGLFALLLAMEIVALSGAVPAPHLVLSAHRVSPFMAGVLAVAFLVHLRSRPRGAEVGVTLALAGVVAAVSSPRPKAALLAGYSLGVASLVVLAGRRALARGEAQARAGDTLATAAVFPLFFMSMVTGLGLTVVLHPATFDGALFHLDAALRVQPSFVVGRWFAASPALAWTCETVYRWLPLAAGVLLLGRPRREGTASAQRMLETFIASGVLGFLLYHLCPAIGPGYAFRGQFPFVVPPAHEVSTAPFLVLPFDRNCVPSLHTTWALFLLWFSRGAHPVLRVGAVVWLVCTLLATLGLGEHYAVDLVVAVPFAVGVHALGARDLPLSRGERTRPILLGAALSAIWIVAMRHAAVAPRGLVVGLVLASLAVPLALHVRLVRALDAAPVRERDPAPEAAPGTSAMAILVLLLGAAAAIDLVIAYRTTQLTAGHAASARAWILAAGLSGAATGAWVGGRLDARDGAPWKHLAYCALALGAAGAIAPRFALIPVCFLVALPVPVIVTRFGPGLVGGAGALGGALGALGGAYLLMPGLGMHLSTLPALVLGLVVALVGLRLSRSEIGAGAPASEAPALPAPPPLPLLACAALGVPVAIAFSDRLGRAAGDTAYTSALVVAATLLGLAAGSFGARRLLARGVTVTPRLLAGLGVALVIALVACAPRGLEAYFDSFFTYKPVRDFGAHQLVRAFVALATTSLPAALAGAIVTASLARDRARSPGKLIALGLFAASLGAFATGVAARRDRASHVTSGALRLGDDGRRALRAAIGTFDAVIVDPVDFQRVHAAPLVTREAVTLAKARLGRRSTLQIVVPLDRTFEDDLVAMIATVHAELPSIWIYILGPRATIVASATPEPPRGLPDPARGIDDDRLVLVPDEVSKLVAARARVAVGSLVLTDDDARLLWTGPRAASASHEELFHANQRLLRDRGR